MIISAVVPCYKEQDRILGVLEKFGDIVNHIIVVDDACPETELSAVATSVTNECIYCTAVHASRYNDLTKTTSDIDSIFKNTNPVDLDTRKRSIYNFSHKLSLCPPEVVKDDVAELSANGLEADEILDIVLSSSIFSWANRLMLGLGEPLESKPQ